MPYPDGLNSFTYSRHLVNSTPLAVEDAAIALENYENWKKNELVPYIQKWAAGNGWDGDVDFTATLQMLDDDFDADISEQRKIMEGHYE